MIKKIKNNTLEIKIWCGQEIQPNEYYQIKLDEDNMWNNNSELLIAIANSSAIINDGEKDIVNINEAINWLKGNQGQYSKDGKQITWSTPRILGTHLVFSGVSDAVDEDEISIWDGDKFKFHHKVGETDLVKEFTFHTIENITTLNEAIVSWKDCDFDEVTIEILPKKTTYEVGVNTNFQSYGSIIVPVTGTGNITPIKMEFVNGTIDELGNKSPGFWDATWDTVNHEWTNIIPQPSGSGAYNLFIADVVLYTLAKDILLLDSGIIKYGTNEASLYLHDTKLRISAKTNLPDHEWKLALNFVLCRQKTQ